MMAEASFVQDKRFRDALNLRASKTIRLPNA